jgi:hypothetical protein
VHKLILNNTPGKMKNQMVEIYHLVFLCPEGMSLSKGGIQNETQFSRHG